MIIDSNILIRYFTTDNPELNEDATKIIESNKCIITDLVFAEVIYVLNSVYKYTKDDLLCLLEVLELDNLKLENKEINLLAFTRFCTTSIDFTDAWIMTKAEIEGKKVMTFDKKLNTELKSKHLTD